MQDFSNSPIKHILDWLHQKKNQQSPGEIVQFLLLNPDLFGGHYSGEIVGSVGFYRSYQALVDLAEVTGFQLLTPVGQSGKKVLIREALTKDFDAHCFYNEDKFLHRHS